ncbi:hypothetical protein EVB78_065 [Rhizobium phage RHph_N1_15]|nr:hypothetical protein EVB77_064 [Rhizobium phage RHph_N1_10]QIG69267.1 hypothetical protein EVB78_065 [Rhizobium phage RHph_N1_15]QIG75127.1 hypothetical protein EVC15_065 [Rhizobium phage RHph_N2_6]
MIKALLAPYLGPIAAVLAVIVVAAGIYVYQLVYDRGWNARDVQARQEMEDMRKANAFAVASAEKGLREDVAALVLKIQELENASVQLDVQADQDSGSSDVGIKRSGVQRLNAIR